MNGVVLLRAEGLEVRRGGRVVLRVDELAVRQGDILALIGPNGAGKTTLLQVLASLIPPSRGQVLFRDMPVTTDGGGLAYRRRQAMVFQEALLFNTTVFDNVATGLKLRGVPRNRIRERVEYSLARFGIGHLADRSARNISGGEAQRTSLARALATEPEVLFLDEPFSALDPLSRESLVEDLGQVLRDAGITAVMTTHDHSEAMRLANRMAVMAKGQIRQIDSPARVFRCPVDSFVAAFVGMDNQLPAMVSECVNGQTWVELAGRRLAVAGNFEAGTGVTFCVRPEDVQLLSHKDAVAAGAVNSFSARVVQVVPLGHCAKLRLDCGFALTVVTTHSIGQGAGLLAGDAVTIVISPDAVHLMAEDR